MTDIDYRLIEKEIISDARSKLDSGQTSDEKYRETLVLLSRGLCPGCKSELVVVEARKDPSGFCYRYKCGHAMHGVNLTDTIKMRDSLAMKAKRKGFGLLKKTFSGFKPSGDKNLRAGVNIDMVVDRENNEYHQIVKDNQTGRILHEEHEPLTLHHSKGTRNK